MKILQTRPARTPPYSDHAVDVRGRLTSLERLLGRLLPDYVAVALALFVRRNHYDAVVTCDHRTAMVYGALRRLGGASSAFILQELYLDEATMRSRLRRVVGRWTLGGCSCLITNCSAEVDAYRVFLGLPRERCRFLAWPSNLPVEEAAEDDGYVFAAGRSFRDWPTLFAAARQVRSPFVVVAEAAALRGLDKPDNVTVHTDVPRSHYLDLLRRARIVAVPLRPTVRSIGQAVILEAMSLSKPVVAAEVPGVVDYIRPSENGLLYAPGAADSLAAALNRLLADTPLLHRLSQGANEAVRLCFNKPRYSADLVELIREFLPAKG